MPDRLSGIHEREFRTQARAHAPALRQTTAQLERAQKNCCFELVNISKRCHVEGLIGHLPWKAAGDNRAERVLSI